MSEVTNKQLAMSALAAMAVSRTAAGPSSPLQRPDEDPEWAERYCASLPIEINPEVFVLARTPLDDLICLIQFGHREDPADPDAEWVPGWYATGFAVAEDEGEAHWREQSMLAAFGLNIKREHSEPVYPHQVALAIGLGLGTVRGQWAKLAVTDAAASTGVPVHAIAHLPALQPGARWV